MVLSFHHRIRCIVITTLGCLACLSGGVDAAQLAHEQPPEKIIIDTDIGDDIDDAFAVALAVRSPEFNILGITTAYGDTEVRARILDRMLAEAGRQDIPVAIGVPTAVMYPTSTLSQRRYGEGGHFARTAHHQAVQFILEQISRYPGQITLVTIATLPNIGALIDQDAATFRKLKRVVMMGGSIGPLKPDYGNAPSQGPIAEWNILMDVSAAQKLFNSGVPLYVMPLDATFHLKLDDVRRNAISANGAALTDAWTLLYHQWSMNDAGGIGLGIPVLHDALPLVYLLSPALCVVQSMHIRIDEKGFTRVETGAPNANVCLHSDAEAVMQFYLRKLLAP
jgi:inosine-uridine nucleoside N-ribohydrolase